MGEVTKQFFLLKTILHTSHSTSAKCHWGVIIILPAICLECQRF